MSPKKQKQHVSPPGLTKQEEDQFTRRLFPRSKKELKKKRNIPLAKVKLRELLVSVYSLGVDILRLSDNARTDKVMFDDFVSNFCNLLITACQDICAIDEQL